MIDSLGRDYEFRKAFVALCFTAVVISSEHFWLFAFAGIKDAAQIAIYSFTGAISFFIIFKKIKAYASEPLFILSCLFLLGSFLFRTDRYVLPYDACRIILVAAIFCLSIDYCDSIVKFLVVVMFVFSVLGIFQFSYLALFNEHIKDAAFHMVEESYLYRGNVDFHPLMFFGFSTGEVFDFFGFTITRVSSFVKEPSVVGPYFLVIGLLATTYKNRLLLLGRVIVFFAFLTFSASIWAAGLLSVIGFIWLTLIRKNNFVSMLLPCVVLVLFIFVVYSFGADWVSDTVANWLPGRTEKGVFNKESSMNIRLSALLNSFSNMGSVLLGSSEFPSDSVGMVFYAIFYCGIIGGVVSLFLLGQMLKSVGLLFSKNGYGVFCSMMFGYFMYDFVFGAGGLAGQAGFIIMALVLRRLRYLAQETTPTRECLA